MATIAVGRVIAADPTSAALLLAGASAFELWPGVTRVAPGLVSASVPALVPYAARVRVRALPPRRQPAAYVSRFEFSGDGLPSTEGTVTLSYVGAAGRPLATAATLALTYDPPEGRADRARVAAAFRAMGAGFLANLAAAAEARADAA